MKPIGLNTLSHMRILTVIARIAKRVRRGVSTRSGIVLLASLTSLSSGISAAAQDLIPQLRDVERGLSSGISAVVQSVACPPPNAFRAGTRLPREIRRVAVLPIAAESTDPDIDFGQESLQPVLVGELNKRGLFEVVLVTPEQLTHWTGKSHWSTAEKLPAQLLERLRDDLGCDAALFARLSQYKAYPPLAVGWNLQLVLVDHPRTYWAADEVFDMSEGHVAASAEQYGRKQFEGQHLHTNPSSISLSPKQFGQYSLAALLATLPAR